MNRIRNTILLCLLFLGIATTANAQTAAEIEAARAIARQYGYSESEINAFLNNRTTISTQQAIETQPVGRVTQPAATPAVVVPVSSVVDNTDTPPSRIYGHDVFRTANLNFIPSLNIPTPEDYTFAPGDEIVIDIWGDTFKNITQVISPEGSINIPDLGPVYLTGLTLKKAERTLRDHLSGIYSGLTLDNPTTFMKVSLGAIRSFSINVLGDVEKPGTYTIPSLSTIASALYLAGGMTNLGTVRAVKLYRNNQLINTFDVYDFIIDGKYDTNIRLEDNDIIKVDPYLHIVSLEGSVKRPMQYELKEGETIASLLRFCGGFANMAYTGKVRVTRYQGMQPESFDVAAGEFGSFVLLDGDRVTVASNSLEMRNRVTIEGSVWYPGDYSLSDTLTSLSRLFHAAGGLKEETYRQKGQILRYGADKEPIILNFVPADIVSGKADITLMKDDVVRLYTVQQLKEQGTVYISGAVQNPTQITYREGLTLMDAVLLAMGFSDGASRVNITVARRKYDAVALTASNQVAQLFAINLEENPDDERFPLQPYDMIMVRYAPDFVPQQTVSVTGEVVFPGTYVVENNEVRLSEVIRLAHGLKETAYPKGARLERRLDAAAAAVRENVQTIAQEVLTSDSLVMRMMPLQGGMYSVGIDLEAALARPGSEADIILRMGDVITIPKQDNTVRVNGAVLYPNAVSYNESFSWRDYVSQAGGPVKGAHLAKTYIVYQNGKVATKKTGLHVEPGCEIIIPQEPQRERRGISVAEIAALASSVTAIATMVITLVNITSSN